jgi:hypothetical protein
LLPFASSLGEAALLLICYSSLSSAPPIDLKLWTLDEIRDRSAAVSQVNSPCTVKPKHTLGFGAFPRFWMELRLF